MYLYIALYTHCTCMRMHLCVCRDFLYNNYASYTGFLFLSLLRLSTKIRGFTRETLIALTTTIESREGETECYNYHPRASNTDDVECFFSVLRSIIGNHFTTKDVKFAWRKFCIEFSKRLDKNLPYYYYTSKQERFIEGDRPSFDIYIRSQLVIRDTSE